ncbi:hypothetical protein OROHE_015313 [Orobanche hederae]
MVPPLEAEEILTYIKKPSKRIGLALYSKLYVHSNVVQKKRVAWILFFKIRPSQDILKIRDGTPLEAEGILTYIKNPRNGTVWHFYSKLYVPSNVVQKKGVARILFFKIRPSQEILKIHDGTPLEAEEILTYIKRVAQILLFKIRLSQEILKNRDCTPLDAEEILTYIKKALETDWPSQEILKIHDGTPLEKRVARILFSKIRPSQEILKNCDGTPLEAEEILTYIKNPRNGSVWHFSRKLYVPSNVVQKKRVARILFFKIRPSQEILKIHDGTPLEAEEILTYIKRNIVQKKRVAQILFFKIRLSQEILKNRDGTHLEAEEILTYIKKALETDWFVARILFSKIRPSQEILKNRDGTPLEAEEILTYIKDPRNGSVWPSQEILKIRDGTPWEAEEILTYIKNPRTDLKLDVPRNIVQKKRVAQILFFKIRLSQEILKNRDGTHLEAEEILTYIKNPRTDLKLDVPRNIVQKKRVAQILFFKIRLSQEILKNRDGTHLEAEEILTYIKKALETDWPSQEILKIHEGTPLEAEEILTYIKKPSKWIEILKIRDGTPLEIF